MLTEEILLAMCRGNPAANTEELKSAGLREHRFITMPKGSSLFMHTNLIYPLGGFVPNIAIQSDDLFYIRKYVELGLGIDEEGRKDILGIWIGENESAAFWTTIFNELKNRGVKEILIACHDNLSGFANALSTVFPKTENQLCIIHMIRNSTKFVSYKDIKPIMAEKIDIFVRKGNQ